MASESNTYVIAQPKGGEPEEAEGTLHSDQLVSEFTFTAEDGESVVSLDPVVEQPENYSTSDLIFIYSMIKAVRRGDFGNELDRIDSLYEFGFNDDQVESLLSAADKV